MSMTNRDLEATWSYHNGTKHSYWSVRSGPHFLDWANQPLPFKIYPALEPIPLPQDLQPSTMPALTAVSTVQARKQEEAVPDTRQLARLLYFSAGITRRKRYPGGEVLFRAAACTGALYHIDLYLVCGPLPDLEAGVYHFGVHDMALRRLRSGDYRSLLIEASGKEAAVQDAPLILVATDTFWRNAWKYRARAYRHAFWDSGTILANLLAVAAARGVPARVVLGFVDREVNRLLGLDTQREVALSLVPLGWAPRRSHDPPPQVAPLSLETLPLSRKEVDYPAIREMHLASCLATSQEVVAWRDPSIPLHRPGPPKPSGPLFPLRPLTEGEVPEEPVERVILRRGSTRKFAREPITFTQLSTLLHRATRGIPADFLDPAPGGLNDLYLIVHAVEGLPSGAYFFHREGEALELLREGDFRRQAGYLGLEQALPADASVDIFFLADLKPILERFGNRGYRAAQLEAGILGGKLYLLAYGMGLGASGLTFYDDEVTNFFSPHAQGKSVMFLVAVGRSARRTGWEG